MQMRQLILIGFFSLFFASISGQLTLKKLTETKISPICIVDKGNGTCFLDFGKAAFGTLAFQDSLEIGNSDINVILSESLSDVNTPEMHLKGTIRSWQGKLKLRRFNDYYILDLPKFSYPQGFVPVPHYIKNILPFRYCQLSGLAKDFDINSVKQLAVWYPFNNDASRFSSSSDTLNKIWDLCKYSIKATTFCGVYVDGDRERKPYEADAYINQLGHYCVDKEYALARYSQEYFFEHPTWPTEWKSHSVFMAWQDYLYTGNTDFLVRYYDNLKNEKALLQPLNKKGLLVCTYSGNRKNDIVDWPMSERDGYELKEINLVPNAFYYKSLVIMADIAKVLGKKADYRFFTQKAKSLKTVINRQFFDPKKGLYVDAVGSNHVSLHGNMFPLAFGLVENKYKPHLIQFIKSRRMACSVYGAQYLLEALYQENEAEYALILLQEGGERSWLNMLKSGSTITLEAWDIKFKPNLDWNHAWGAAPANIIPRQLFGIQPTSAGFSTFSIKPQTAGLRFGEIKTPTLKGDIIVKFTNDRLQKSYMLELEIPANTKAELFMPNPYGGKLFVNGKALSKKCKNGFFKFHLSPGNYKISTINNK